MRTDTSEMSAAQLQSLYGAFALVQVLGIKCNGMTEKETAREMVQASNRYIAWSQGTHKPARYAIPDEYSPFLRFPVKRRGWKSKDLIRNRKSQATRARR